MNGEPPGGERDQRDHDRPRLEHILPELIKRLLDAGYDKLSEGPENVRNFVNEMKLPKEVLNLLLTHIDETKNGLYRVVAREIRDFLEHSSVSDEMARALTKLSLEIRTEVRFVPNDASAKPEVHSEVRVRNSESDPPGRRPSASAPNR